MDHLEVAIEERDREAKQDPEPDISPDPYTATSEARALESRPTAPAGPSSARLLPLVSSTLPVPRKQTRVDDPVARPRLGGLGFDVEDYVTHHDGIRLEDYRCFVAASARSRKRTSWSVSV